MYNLDNILSDDLTDFYIFKGLWGLKIYDYDGSLSYEAYGFATKLDAMRRAVEFLNLFDN